MKTLFIIVASLLLLSGCSNEDLKKNNIRPQGVETQTSVKESYWESGQGKGSREYWNNGTVKSSKSYWETGSNVGSADYWVNGKNTGSAKYWETGKYIGSLEYWNNGKLAGSKHYWENGSQKGSRSYWKTGAKNSIFTDKNDDEHYFILICMALLEEGVAESTPSMCLDIKDDLLSE